MVRRTTAASQAAAASVGRERQAWAASEAGSGKRGQGAVNDGGECCQRQQKEKREDLKCQMQIFFRIL